MNAGFKKICASPVKIIGILMASFFCVTLVPFDVFAAPASCGTSGIFAGVMCTLETILDSIAKKLFDAIANDLKPAILGALTLYIIIFAVSFLAGIINLTAREFTVTLFKFGLVWNFAAFWDNGAGLAYEFFKTFAVSGGDIVWQAVTGSGGGGIAGITKIDTDIAKAVGFASNSASGTALNVGGVPMMCVMQLGGMMVLLFMMQPPLIAFLFIYIYNFIKLFATAILYYFKSLILIAFLIILSPIFVSFALFQRTRELFETWIKHLAVNALQMLIMFAFFAMILLVDFKTFFDQLFSLFKIWNPVGAVTNLISYTLGFGALHFQTGICSICDYTVSADYTNISCKPGNDVIPPFAIPIQFDFWVWLITKVISLQILSYILTDFLEKAPSIAQQLAGTRYGGLLVGSGSNPGFAGYTNFAFAAIESGAAAFKQAQRDAHFRPGIIGAVPFVASMRNPLSGDTYSNLKNSFKIGLGVMSADDPSVKNRHLDSFHKEIDDYSKRAMNAKRAAQKAEGILRHNEKLEKDGKIPRAALVSSQNSYNQSLKVSQLWDRKLDESKEKLAEAIRKQRESGAKGFLTSLNESLNPLYAMDRDYNALIEKQKKQEHSAQAMAFFLPVSATGISQDEAELHRLNIEAMQDYGKNQIDSLYIKLEKSGVSEFEKSRIQRDLGSASSDLQSGDIDAASHALDSLRSISRDLE
jgi:type IV secretory pathway VirB6-like protein